MLTSLVFIEAINYDEPTKIITCYPVLCIMNNKFTHFTTKVLLFSFPLVFTLMCEIQNDATILAFSYSIVGL